MIQKILGGGGVVLILLGIGLPVYGMSLSEDAIQADTASLEQAVKEVTPPNLEQPQWLKDQIAKEQATVAPQPAGSSSTGSILRTVNYSVSTLGSTRSSFQEFAAQANATLNDSRGWASIGISFQQVSSGGSFNLVLAEASRVGQYAGCSAEWSCRSGSSVLINDDRWSGGTAAWNNGDGGIRDYRHMVVNHEVGHWLGHGHEDCSGAGNAAPVMQQQSIDLQGCRFNPWPLSHELTAPTLGL